MKRQSIVKFVIMLSMAVLLTGCRKDRASENPRWDECKQIYATVVHYSGENDSTEKYLEIAERSQRLFQLLEEKADAFVMNAYNYQALDEKGTPLYTMNTFSYPEEI